MTKVEFFKLHNNFVIVFIKVANFCKKTFCLIRKNGWGDMQFLLAEMVYTFWLSVELKVDVFVVK